MIIQCQSGWAVLQWEKKKKSYLNLLSHIINEHFWSLKMNSDSFLPPVLSCLCFSAIPGKEEKAQMFCDRSNLRGASGTSEGHWDHLVFFARGGGIGLSLKHFHHYHTLLQTESKGITEVVPDCRCSTRAGHIQMWRDIGKGYMEVRLTNSYVNT